MLTVKNLTELATLAGQSLGTTDYIPITQEMVDRFAEATGDYQWIHTDPKRAANESPYKTTIAHGFLTLSLAPQLMAQLYRVESVRMGINYGANKIRFTNAVPVGSKLRMNTRLISVEPQAIGYRVSMECIFEIENQPKPACIAELITLLFE
ncbi:MaoC family dehydratase [Spirosoma panaciterrae]|uniref:MaoC family dehydratase n=1 Tax=Spirosoma panaciterrae TaxID=496058 RepID=UPI000373ED03|nr:MaoC family dehydratase [Spirosoma panaciterrae]